MKTPAPKSHFNKVAGLNTTGQLLLIKLSIFTVQAFPILWAKIIDTIRFKFGKLFN